MKEGKLVIVPTPIGNLEDITLRAVRVLNEVDLILAEDTRTSLKLLSHLNIKKPLESHHKFNEFKTSDTLVERIKKGLTVALISDAGTPGISDPGSFLIKACIESQIEVDCLPGPTAFVPALVASGLSSMHFVFEGFLPPKKGRQTKIQELANEKRTVIIYESPYRILKTLEAFSKFVETDRRIVACRELSKMYQEYIRGTISELITHFSQISPKGEFVLILEGKEKYNKNKND